MAIVNGYITLTEFKNYNKITSTNATDDSVIEDIIEGVSRTIDTFTGRTFYARTETHYYDVPEGRDLFIEDDDLLTITTLTNGDGTVITSTYYKLLPLNETPKNVIRLIATSGLYWTFGTNGEPTGAITVAGTWGRFASVPDDIKLVCMHESMNEYHRRFGENLSTSATVTASGVVLTPRGMASGSVEKLVRYRVLT